MISILIIGRKNQFNRGEEIMVHGYKINENSTLYWLSHSSFKIKTNGKIIYMDPYDISDIEAADIVLITHSHYDHCSIADLQKIVGQNTVIVAPGDCTSKFAGKVGGRLELVNVFDKKNIDGINIEAVPAYNIDKQFHKRENGWVGYIIDVAGVKVYHAGDTDLIPEMSDIKTDIALLPVGGKFTMDSQEAAKACDLIKPKIAIPMHYDKIVGSKDDAQDFKRKANCNVIII